MLALPIHERTTFILVRPHYPENVGAAARAIKTMGFTQLILVKPGRLAVPTHEMARKMAVKSLDVLDAARIVPTLLAAIEKVDLVIATTSRRGVSHVLSAGKAAERALDACAQDQRVAFVLGNEKTGLSPADLALCQKTARIPMAADQPSVNLAQSAQILAYELFVRALARRESASDSAEPTE
jgi:tRNA/rRNA methyltransferase